MLVLVVIARFGFHENLFGVMLSSVLLWNLLCLSSIVFIRFLVLFILLSTFLICFLNITWRLIYSKRKQVVEMEHRRAFLIGAGDGGALFMNNYQHPASDLELVGDFWITMKRKRDKNWVESSFGLYDNQHRLAKRHQIERVIGDPSLDPSEYDILQMCNKLGVKCYKMHKVETVVQDSINQVVASEK